MTKIPYTRHNAASSRPRVLVIEDNPDQMALMEDLVGLLGYVAKAAPDAATGMDMARNFRPDVILSDIGLPDMSGFELARLIKADDTLKDICLVALSGYGTSSDIETSESVGFNRHLLKPVALETLRDVLAELLEVDGCRPA